MALSQEVMDEITILTKNYFNIYYPGVTHEYLVQWVKRYLIGIAVLSNEDLREGIDRVIRTGILEGWVKNTSGGYKRGIDFIVPETPGFDVHIKESQEALEALRARLSGNPLPSQTSSLIHTTGRVIKVEGNLHSGEIISVTV